MLSFQRTVITIILIIVFLSILYVPIHYYLKQSEKFDNNSQARASLDIYYHEKDRRTRDQCGDCAGLCLYCNQGKNQPNVCNKHIIHSANQEDCPDLTEWASEKYIYIISYPFRKYLTFDTYGNQSNVFVRPATPDDQGLVHINKQLPQKWEFLQEGCHMIIRSYSANPGKIPYYYLYANRNGTLGVSLFKGSLNQYWEIIKNDNETYFIKSFKYCTFLSSTNSGYILKNSGLTYLTNNTTKNELWYLRKSGSIKADKIKDLITTTPVQILS